MKEEGGLMEKLVLGLDIGISSIGWAVVNKNQGKVVDSGVRLFKEGTAADNLTRRNRRGSRRLVRRRNQRLDDFITLFKKFGLVTQPVHLDNPLELRVKGLNESLTNDELFTALFHILKHRGTSFETVSENPEEEGTKGVLNENDKLLKKGKYVCEVQLARLRENGSYRGTENTFKTQDYVKEVEKILSVQRLSEELKKEIIELVNRRRHFSEGPGSKISPTPYGRFIMNEDGEIETIDLIEKMRGKCSVFPDELRAPKLSPSVELFNLLNDLNNLTYENQKLSTNQKQKIINDFIINNKHSITIKQLAKFLETDENQLIGLRQDEKKGKIISEFKGLKKILNVIDEDRKSFYADNLEVLDQIINVLTKTKVIDERISGIKALNFEFIEDNEIERFANIPGVSGYHALSLKAVYLLNKEMINTNENQMQVLHRLNLVQNDLEKYENLKSIPSSHDLILNPVVQRALNETIKTINSARQQYGEFDSIIIEMARDKNSDEQKNRIKRTIEKRREQNNQILNEIKKDDVDKRSLLKLLLYNQQLGKCVYTGESLDINTIINDPTAYDIDHIIPISVSYDDSLNNKVLVTSSANRDKGNLSPLIAFDNHRFMGWSKEEYISYIDLLFKNKHINEKKRSYLLSEEDITKYSNLSKFVARNLVDTRYASRSTLNILQDYFRANNISTKVFTIRGSLTSVIRNKVGIKKDRDDNYVHHAIDAATIALLTNNNQIEKLLRRLSFNDGQVTVEENSENPIVEYKEFYDEGFMQKFVELRNLSEEHFINDEPFPYIHSKIKVSHKVDKKPNRKITDDTIYSTRVMGGKKQVVKKYKDIYDSKFLHLAKDIQSKKYEKYLMYHNDFQTFKKLIEIVEDYVNEFGNIKSENPFNVYYKKHGKVKKYAKKDNGPEITSMKYFDGELKSHVSISHKYNSEKKDVVLLQVKPYRTDFYKSKEGKYSFVTIRMHHVQFSDMSKKYYIDADIYNELKKEKGVDKEFEFQFSMHRNEYIYIEQKTRISKDVYDITKDIYRYVATNNDISNVIEVNPIHYHEKKQLMKTIGKNIILLNKYHCDQLGNIHQVNKEDLKLEFEIGKM